MSAERESLTAARSYPEHEKLAAVQAESQAVGAFLDSCGFTLCAWREHGDNGLPHYIWIAEPRTKRGKGRKADGEEPDVSDYANSDANPNPALEEWPSGWYPVANGIQRILADYFEIDLDEIEREKRAMLAALRSQS